MKYSFSKKKAEDGGGRAGHDNLSLIQYFFFRFLDLEGYWFFFFALGFHFSSLIYRRNFFLPFPPFPSFLSKCYIEAENLLFFFAGLFLSFFYSVAAHFFFIVVVACKWQFSCRYAYAQRVVETTTFAIPATFKLRTLFCRGVLLSVPSSSFPKSKGTSRISETKTSKQGEREEEEKNGVVFFLSHKCVSTIVEEQYSRCFRWQIVSATCRNPVHRTSSFFFLL